MKNYPIRKVDPMFRVNIPKNMRDQLNIQKDQYIQLKIKDGAIILQPLEFRPVS